MFLLGSGIGKSISPAIQNRAFAKVGLNARYSLYEVHDAEFDSAMHQIQLARDILGFNITAPFKERILPYLTRLDDIAKEVGAVNTVKIGKGRGSERKWLGFNTDVAGIIATLSKLDVKGGKPQVEMGRDTSKVAKSPKTTTRRCVILGAGGAARACVDALLKYGFDSIVILNRNIERARQVSNHFGRLFPHATIDIFPLTKEQFLKTTRNCDLLINAVTNTNPFPIRIDFSQVRRDMKVFDLGYKEVSSVLKAARTSKLESIDGLTMLVAQAAKCFEIWTGTKAPTRAMLFEAKREVARLSDAYVM